MIPTELLVFLFNKYFRQKEIVLGEGGGGSTRSNRIVDFLKEHQIMYA